MPIRAFYFVTLFCLAHSLAAASTAAAKEKKPSYVDPKHVDADYVVQGEYVGKVEVKSGEQKYGVQVVALGGGKFDAYAYPGGLPGAGWKKKSKRTGKIRGTTENGVTAFPGLIGESAAIRDGKMTVRDGGRKIGSLKRIVRRSPTLGKKPPKGAVVLFDGKSAKRFKGGRMSPDGLLMEGATSIPRFQDCLVHLEFRTPYEPYNRGQGRGNSGCYLQGRYEVQILDSFGLEGKHHEAGGIYSVRDPNVNMCFPPLTWQTYDIKFRAARFDEAGKMTEPARMTVHHNGVLVQKDVPVKKHTTAAPERVSPRPGPIFLQNHSHPVRFKNIWVVPLDEE